MIQQTKHKLIQVSIDSSFFSKKLDHYKKNGTIALHAIPISFFHTIVLASWSVGWTVAVIPDDQKAFINKDLNLDILIDGSHTQAVVNTTQSYLTLHVKTFQDLSFKNFLPELNDNKFSFSFSHIWGPKEIALILYTSGSSGQAKGVCHSLQNVTNSSDRFTTQFGITEKDIILNTAAPYTMTGFRSVVMVPYLSGCQVQTIAGNTHLSEIIESIQQYKSNILIVGPNIINQIALLADRLCDEMADLQLILSTGASLNRASRERIYDKLQLPILDYYGLTETSGISIAETLSDFQPSNRSMGRACNDIQLSVLNDDNTESSYGKGELLIYSDSLYLNYLGEEKKQTNPFYTGDQVLINTNNEVTWLNRLSNGIKSSITTEWIFSETITRWLLEQRQVEDVHITTFVDQYMRSGFHLEVSGISKEQWKVWVLSTTQDLVTDLGESYKIIQFERVDTIVRSNLGKYLNSKS